MGISEDEFEDLQSLFQVNNSIGFIPSSFPSCFLQDWFLGCYITVNPLWIQAALLQIGPLHLLFKTHLESIYMFLSPQKNIGLVTQSLYKNVMQKTRELRFYRGKETFQIAYSMLKAKNFVYCGIKKKCTTYFWACLWAKPLKKWEIIILNFSPGTKRSYLRQIHLVWWRVQRIRHSNWSATGVFALLSQLANCGDWFS